MEISTNGWIAVAGYVCMAVMYVASVIINLIIKKKTSKGESTTTLTAIENILNEFIPSAMIDAENSGMTGTAKKLFVLARVVIECASKGVSYEENSTTFDECIERLISLSKQVNATSSDTKTEETTTTESKAEKTYVL